MRVLLALIMVLSLSSFAHAQETLTISTYYPSPYGSYNELQAGNLKIGNNNTNTTADGVVNFWPQAAPATANEGDLFYNSGMHAFQYKDNTAGLRNLSKSFGSWLVVAANTTYQASTDGFVVAKARCLVMDNWITIVGKTDSNNPPITQVLVSHCNSNPDNIIEGSFTMPVKKGDYWRVDLTRGSSANVTVNWIPLQ